MITLPCSLFICDIKTSLWVKRRSHSLQVQPGHEGDVDDGVFVLRRSVALLVFLMAVGFFLSPFSRPLREPTSLLLVLGVMELIGLLLRGRLMPRLGGPSMVFRVPCAD